MNIQTILLSSLALVGCNIIKSNTDDTSNTPPTGGGNCGGDYTFEEDREITAGVLESLLNGSDDLATVTCEDLCRYYQYDMVDMTSCDALLNFETLPDDFYDMSSSEVVGTVECSGVAELICEGRRPIGYIDSCGQRRGLGEYCAHVAQLEAASIIAFVELARQLKCHGAPAHLIQRCLMAAKDEIHHANAFMTLAKNFGETIPAIIREKAPEDLFHIALHNAVEGCVFETWAALKAHHQSIHCQIPTLKKLYARVADDETRHGQLAWDLHHWLMTQLSETQRSMITSAQRDAFVRLQDIAAAQMEIPALGRPNRTDAIFLAKTFTKKIFA